METAPIAPESGQPAIRILSVEDLSHSCGHFQIVDARPQSDFESGHIPGAIWLGWEDWCDDAPVAWGSILSKKGYWGGLKRAPAEWYAERLRDCGLRRDDAIVVYADGPGSRGREGRIAWMLLYLGAPSVMLLDGGWNAWLELGGDVEKEPTTLGSGDFRVSFQAHRRCSVTQLADEWMSPARPQLVDTRSVAEFAGEVQPYLPRRGHLPGAVLVSFSSLFDAGGRFIDRETYLTLLPAAARRPDNIVAFCEVGVRASLFALLHEMYAGSVVRVCDGSLIEWGLASGLPLETDTPLTA